MGRKHNNKTSTLAVQAAVQGIQMGLKRKDLALQFNLAKSSITRIYKRYQLRQGVVIRKSPGRPRKTNHLTDRNIVMTSRTNPRLSAGEISAIVDGPMTPVPHVRTIRRRLAQSGLNGRRPAKKPFINAKNRKIRVDWAKAHVGWRRAEWKSVLCSDESKYNLFGSDGVKWIRRPVGTRYSPQYQTPTMKHGGGSICVWGCFSAYGMGPLVRISGLMDRFQYESILENHMRPFDRVT